MVGITAESRWGKSHFTVFGNTLSLRLMEDQPLEPESVDYFSNSGETKKDFEYE
jgi:hypothetical protein